MKGRSGGGEGYCVGTRERGSGGVGWCRAVESSEFRGIGQYVKKLYANNSSASLRLGCMYFFLAM